MDGYVLFVHCSLLFTICNFQLRWNVDDSSNLLVATAENGRPRDRNPHDQHCTIYDARNTALIREYTFNLIFSSVTFITIECAIQKWLVNAKPAGRLELKRREKATEVQLKKRRRKITNIINWWLNKYLVLHSCKASTCAIGYWNATHRLFTSNGFDFGLGTHSNR